MTEKRQNNLNPKLRWLKIIVTIVFCLFFSYLIPSCTSEIQEKKPAESPFQPLPEAVTSTDKMEDVDFSHFKHDSIRHKTVPCLLCHQNNPDDPNKPRFASHTPCAGCHTPQFADNNHKICVICHTENGSDKLRPFPPMRSFKVNFNHTAHFKETNCATCHQNQGVGMSVPNGGDAHATCFQCHTSDKVVGDKNIGSCSTCHELGTPTRIVDRAENIGFNFSHSRHSGLNCNSCHNSLSASKMSVITVGMHAGAANSCASCHNNQRAFGANDFTDCRKCHEQVANTSSFGVRFNHANHTKANCVTCHKSGGNGLNFSVPNGQNAHTTCFQCHSPMKDRGSFSTSKCFQCHQAGSTNQLAASIQVKGGIFNHTKHRGMSCNACHKIGGNGVSEPTIAMHKAGKGSFSCATCHNNQKAFGGDDFTDCKRCHVNNKFTH